MHKSELHNVHTFSSPAEFGENCLNSNYWGRTRKAEEFTNWLTLPEACKLTIEGDDSQVAAAQSLMEKFQLSIETSSFTDMPSVAGCYPCVPEALMGEPECMREPMEIPSDTAPLQIVVDLACTHIISAEQMEKRGVAILALVLALSATRPISLKFISCLFSKKKTGRDNYSIVAIDIPTTPIDLATSCYLLANVGFVRQMMYGYAWVNLDFNGKYPKFDGMPKNSFCSVEYIAKMKECLEIEEEFLLIPQAREGEEVLIDPVKWLQDQLAQYQHHI